MTLSQSKYYQASFSRVRTAFIWQNEKCFCQDQEKWRYSNKPRQRSLCKCSVSKQSSRCAAIKGLHKSALERSDHSTFLWKDRSCPCSIIHFSFCGLPQLMYLRGLGLKLTHSFRNRLDVEYISSSTKATWHMQSWLFTPMMPDNALEKWVSSPLGWNLLGLFRS